MTERTQAHVRMRTQFAAELADLFMLSVVITLWRLYG